MNLMPDKSFVARGMAFLLVLSLVGGLVACGKKGPPVPQDHKSMVSWKKATASMNDEGCLYLDGELEGAFANVSRFVLELEPVDDAMCVDCPFLPREIAVVTSPSGTSPTPSFQYCPRTRAEAYRWRLIAHNVYTAFPHALSAVGLVTKAGKTEKNTKPETAPAQ